MYTYSTAKMGKKCLPMGSGIICFENMTLFVLVLLTIGVGYLHYVQFVKPSQRNSPAPQRNSPAPQRNSPAPQPQITYVSQDSHYVPPLNTIDVRGPIELPPPPHLGVGIPVNIRTSTANTSYRQIGILTKSVRNNDPLILPLFGRNLLNGRDKWQYYTMSNSGGASFNAKLPISVNGRSCTGEYGCDGIYNGDTVYVEGYEDTFRATIYENATMNYIPF
jgi:hypothetical protein